MELELEEEVVLDLFLEPEGGRAVARERREASAVLDLLPAFELLVLERELWEEVGW